MIDPSKVLIALNSHVNANLATLGATCIYGGYTASGALFSASPTESYIDFNLLNGAVSRRSVRGGETDFSRGIYQADCYAPKSGASNPDVVALSLAAKVQEVFAQNATLTFSAQDVQIRYCEVSPRLTNDTHIYYAVSVYYHVSA